MAVPLFPVIALTAVALLSLYKYIVHPLFFHPLRHIPPAHWSIPIFGDLWITYQRYRSRNNAVTYAAHLKHGSVVRMGANELSINCVDNGIKTVYAGGWEKHAWYPQRFGSYGVMNMFSTIHHLPHSQKKRTMANVYSKTYVASAPQIAANSRILLGKRLLPLIESVSHTGEAVNAHDLNNACAMDFISAYLFGLKASTNFIQDVGARKRILNDYHCRREYEFFSMEVPWLKSLTRKLGCPVVPQFVDDANVNLENWNASMCDGAEKYLQLATSSNNADRSSSDPGDEPIVYKQFSTGITNLRKKDPLAGKDVEDQVTMPSTRGEDADATNNTTGTTQAEIYSEMLDHLGAGHETSAVALTYLYWELSKKPDLQKRLREELLTLTPKIVWPPSPPQSDSEAESSFDLPDPKQVDALPLLHAIVMETLRLHAPIPGMEPRISPAGNNTLGSYSNIPGGVRVSAMPYTLHRNPEVFPDPETWKPERWLAATNTNNTTADAAADHLKEMHRWFWAFGSGGRMCIGSNLATQEIKLLTAALYTNWTTEIVDDKDIHEIDAYTIRPTSNRLMLRFRPVSDASTS
ncbi:hypothetical protein HRR83_000040 [Exophiala dermatitidis]|uniref:Cytochrome P450 n=1 Tax=Exophiala dermatitidis TaxID=5970 RepID=A0AAN6IYZ0_EXODE|nr:hypothetical protein HRR73_002574 [Exophiala dermatitidis]KAJ4524447.1 hypothetical protein HRR75_000035 [Exophiala dermatitidis]KAJ4527289.1 hypothetical protein HRR74_000041 [Exophiala dermatitidis]KAJ4530842.1 hypothetical protein HRR76_008536 [Exophiala dermatitidis]KAJ4549757.1 hypothetical protein HRR78_004566 [Exophiala dermatitidis]